MTEKNNNAKNSYLEIIGEIIKKRVHELGISKAGLARKLNMSPANVHKIFKRRTVDTELLRKLCNLLDYNFFQHFEPDLKRQRTAPVPYDVGDTEVLFIRYVVDLQSRVQILERLFEALQTPKLEDGHRNGSRVRKFRPASKLRIKTLKTH